MAQSCSCPPLWYSRVVGDAQRRRAAAVPVGEQHAERAVRRFERLRRREGEAVAGLRSYQLVVNFNCPRGNSGARAVDVGAEGEGRWQVAAHQGGGERGGPPLPPAKPQRSLARSKRQPGRPRISIDLIHAHDEVELASPSRSIGWRLVLVSSRARALGLQLQRPAACALCCGRTSMLAPPATKSEGSSLPSRRSRRRHAAHRRTRSRRRSGSAARRGRSGRRTSSTAGARASARARDLAASAGNACSRVRFRLLPRMIILSTSSQ